MDPKREREEAEALKKDEEQKRETQAGGTQEERSTGRFREIGDEAPAGNDDSPDLGHA